MRFGLSFRYFNDKVQLPKGAKMNHAELTKRYEDVAAEENGCKGIVFRAYSSTYMDSQGNLAIRDGLRKLKRKSCPGCEYCGWWEDQKSDIIPEETFVIADWPLEDGKLYGVRFADDGDAVFFRLKDQEDAKAN